MNMIEVGKTVKHVRDSRVGEIVEIKEIDGRARVRWEACGSKTGMRTWVRFKDLQLLTPAGEL